MADMNTKGKAKDLLYPSVSLSLQMHCTVAVRPAVAFLVFRPYQGHDTALLNEKSCV